MYCKARFVRGLTLFLCAFITATTNALLTKTATRIGSHACVRRCDAKISTGGQLRPTPLFYRRKYDNDNNQPVLETLTSFLTLPLGLFGSSKAEMMLGYPLALALVCLTTEVSTALLTVVLFGILSWLGRLVLLDEYEENADDEETAFVGDILSPSPKFVDFFSLVFSILSAQLLVPAESIAGNGPLDVSLLLAAAGVGLATILAVDNDALEGRDVLDDEQQSSSPQQALLDLWDKQFQQEQRRTKNSKNVKD